MHLSLVDKSALNGVVPPRFEIYAEEFRDGSVRRRVLDHYSS